MRRSDKTKTPVALHFSVFLEQIVGLKIVAEDGVYLAISLNLMYIAEKIAPMHVIIAPIKETYIP